MNRVRQRRHEHGGEGEHAIAPASVPFSHRHPGAGRLNLAEPSFGELANVSGETFHGLRTRVQAMCKYPRPSSSNRPAGASKVMQLIKNCDKRRDRTPSEAFDRDTCPRRDSTYRLHIGSDQGASKAGENHLRGRGCQQQQL